jgi:hypothetical protein
MNVGIAPDRALVEVQDVDETALPVARESLLATRRLILGTRESHGAGPRVRGVGPRVTGYVTKGHTVHDQEDSRGVEDGVKESAVAANSFRGLHLVGD